MKASIIRLLNIFIVVLLLGCQNDFLERAPSDLINEKAVFSVIDNAEAFLNVAYEDIPSLLINNKASGSQFNLGSATDEAAAMWNVPKTAIDFNNGNWNSSSFPMDWAWKDYYASIRKINIFLKNYDLIPEEVNGVVVSSRKKRLYGEAYGLRAYYYFLLYTMWGEIPIIKEPIIPGDPDALVLVRSSLEEVVNFIDSDIENAIKFLTPTHDEANFGRFTSTAAWALRSRLYLYYASELSNPTNDRTRWEKAASVTKQAIEFAESNGYRMSLTENNGKKSYERIFIEMTNPEIIWSTRGYSGSYWDYWAAPLSFNGWYGEGPIQELVDDYEMLNGEIPVTGYNEDDTQIINPKSGYNPLKPYANRDLRFDQTIIYNGSKWKGRNIDISIGGLDYDMGRPRIRYFWKKYQVEQHNLFSGQGAIDLRFIVFRLSELYLNYAEAKNESLSNPDNSVINALNSIRNRGGLPLVSTSLSQKEMREKIRHERRIELVMENHRFWDVRRWRIAEFVDNKPVHNVSCKGGVYSYSIWSNRVFDKNKHYLFPIPQAEIDKNRNLLQNVGWNN